MSGCPQNFFLTGVTGLVGRSILARLARDHRAHKIYVLVRAREKESATARVHDLIRRTFAPWELTETFAKVIPVTGDITLKHLGLDRATFASLVYDVDQIIHAAADTAFNAPFERLLSFNVEGTKSILRLAAMLHQAGRLHRLNVVSTAFVAGRTSGIVDPEDLDRGQPFANAYEYTKYLAEQLVRSDHYRFDRVIFRPSIIVGDSRNGYTPHFKVLYYPLKGWAHGLLPAAACDRDALLDVVPVDFVADAINAISWQPTRKKVETLHLTTGLGQEITIGGIAEDAARFFGTPSLGSPTKMQKKEGRIQEAFVAYRPYLTGTSPRFNANRSHARLAEAGVTTPVWPSYSEKILNYCLQSNWGRKVPLPEHSYFSPSAVAHPRHAPYEAAYSTNHGKVLPLRCDRKHAH